MPDPKSGPIQTIIKPTVKELKRRHAERIKKLKDSKAAYAKVATYLDRWVQTNFKTEGEKVGNWAPFQAGGRWVKGRGIDESAKLLQDTGRMRASYLPFSSRSDAGIGTDLPYAKKHEEGDGVPERRTLPERGEVIDDALTIIEGHVKKATRK